MTGSGAARGIGDRHLSKVLPTTGSTGAVRPNAQLGDQQRTSVPALGVALGRKERCRGRAGGRAGRRGRVSRTPRRLDPGSSGACE